MNDFEPQAILEATADVLREQRKEMLGRIESLEQSLGASSAEIEALRNSIIHANEDVATKLQDAYTSASKQYYTLQAELAELRGQLARMPADPATQVAELKGRLDQLERTPGPAGRDADPEVVARTLLATDGFLALVRGKQGEQGPRGPAADPEELIQRLKADTEFQDLVRDLRGEPGAPGEAADASEVADRLMQNPTFLAKVAGQAGRDGKNGVDGEDGRPGKDADPAEVAKALENNRTFCDLVRGEKGDTGDTGPAGRDANALDVAERLKQDKEFQVWVKPDPIETGKLVGEELRRCDEFVRSLRGQDGRDGADGAGVDVPFYEEGQVYREGATVQCAFGKLYRAVQDTAQHPRGSDHWKRVGLYGFDWLGVKDEKKTYEPGDLYIDKGSTFLVLPDGRQKMFAQRGASGRQGEPGKDGKDGRDGATVIAGVLDGETLRFGLDDGTSFDVDLGGIFRSLDEAAKDKAERAALEVAEQLECDENTIAFTCHRGVWSAGKFYRKGDAVTFKSALWLCSKEHESGQNMSDSYWRRIAAL